jgi:SAM-dependent methyltransferase
MADPDMTFDPNWYVSAYSGCERLAAFASPAALESYRAHLLAKTAPAVAFVARHLGAEPRRVLELAAGNGRLLVALALRGALAQGDGIDIAATRIEFARAWVEQLGLSDMVSLQVADALAYEPAPPGSYDLAALITGAFGYLRPIRESAPQDVLRRIHRALAPGGHVLLELYQLTESRRRMLALSGGHLRTWNPLPAADPFAYYLDEFHYCAESSVLEHEKTFIGRDGTIDTGRIEVLAYHQVAEMDARLAEAGFRRLWASAGFGDEPYREGQSENLVLLAQRLP